MVIQRTFYEEDDFADEEELANIVSNVYGKKVKEAEAEGSDDEEAEVAMATYFEEIEEILRLEAPAIEPDAYHYPRCCRSLLSSDVFFFDQLGLIDSARLEITKAAIEVAEVKDVSSGSGETSKTGVSNEEKGERRKGGSEKGKVENYPRSSSERVVVDSSGGNLTITLASVQRIVKSTTYENQRGSPR